MINIAKPRLQARHFLASAYLIPALFIAQAAIAADDYAQWSRTASIYTNTTADGAGVASTVQGYPLLLRLDASNFRFPEAQGKGQDIRFSTPEGKHLAYQIDRWDSAASSAAVWVKMDSIAGNAKSLSLRMHWGNPAAADSSNGNAVFAPANGFHSVWHLGDAAIQARANAVAGGNPAKPERYDGDESRDGIIGRADSLDGDLLGDFLDLGAGYADFSSGFTYSVWVAPTTIQRYGRLLDLGNAKELDNFVLQSRGVDQDLEFLLFNGATVVSRVRALSVLIPNQWQYIAVTVNGTVASVYRNGVVVATETISNALPVINRVSNFIGKSNWLDDAYFQGKIDEARISTVSRTADWIKLNYASQGPKATLVSFVQPVPTCTRLFSAPSEIAAKEGDAVTMEGVAECATAVNWSLVAGPGPRILDPEVRSLRVILPRLQRDTVLTYRFTAQFGDSSFQKEVVVRVSEAIPDPQFTLPAVTRWNGADSLFYAPTISNLSAIKASKDTLINFSWTLSGLVVDTAWLGNGLLLKSAEKSGALEINLCVDNGGTQVCKSSTLTVEYSVAVKGRRNLSGESKKAHGFDVMGRSVPGAAYRKYFRREPAAIKANKSIAP